MPTNPLKPNTKNVTANIPVEDYIGFSRLVSLSGITKSKYLSVLICYAIEHNLIAGEDLVSRDEWLASLKDRGNPTPDIRYEIKAGAPIAMPAYKEKKLPPNVSVLKTSEEVEKHFDPTMGRAAEEPAKLKRKKKVG